MTKANLNYIFIILIYFTKWIRSSLHYATLNTDITHCLQHITDTQDSKTAKTPTDPHWKYNTHQHNSASRQTPHYKKAKCIKQINWCLNKNIKLRDITSTKNKYGPKLSYWAMRYLPSYNNIQPASEGLPKQAVGAQAGHTQWETIHGLGNKRLTPTQNTTIIFNRLI